MEVGGKARELQVKNTSREKSELKIIQPGVKEGNNLQFNKLNK